MNCPRARKAFLLALESPRPRSSSKGNRPSTAGGIRNPKQRIESPTCPRASISRGSSAMPAAMHAIARPIAGLPPRWIAVATRCCLSLARAPGNIKISPSPICLACSLEASSQSSDWRLILMLLMPLGMSGSCIISPGMQGRSRAYEYANAIRRSGVTSPDMNTAKDTISIDPMSRLPTPIQKLAKVSNEMQRHITTAIVRPGLNVRSKTVPLAKMTDQTKTALAESRTASAVCDSAKSVDAIQASSMGDISFLFSRYSVHTFMYSLTLFWSEGAVTSKDTNVPRIVPSSASQK
mmetsp:Transcript_86181/g.157137  ORF Transcript_86181/g.157137 Transcript_86181/m.157137 type:complete len:294 (-) Transcript_86181:3227-4108(-)